jgi:hypothetical protein
MNLQFWNHYRLILFVLHNTHQVMRIIKSFSFVFFFSAIILIQGNAFAQQAPKIQWKRHFGGTTDQRGLSIVQGDRGPDNYIFAGYTQSNDGDVSGYYGPSATGIIHYGDAWIGSVYDGGLLWQICIGGSDMETANCITKTIDRNYVVTGWTSSKDYNFSDNHGSADAWIAKFDNGGNILWKKCIGGTAADAANCIIETKGDEGTDLVIVGQTNSTDGDCLGNHIKGGGDLWVVRMNSLGTILWQKNFGGSGSDAAATVFQTKDGGFVIAGSTTSNDSDVHGFHGGNNADAWIIKLDRNGNLEWQKCLGGSNYDVANSIIQTSDGGYMIAGVTNSNDGDVTGIHPGFFSESDAWIVKLNPSGTLQWQKCLGGSNQDEAESIILASNGDAIIAGVTGSTDGDFSVSSGRGAWVLRLSDNDSIKWQKNYEGNAWSIINASDGGYAFAGDIGDSIHFYPGYVFVVKLFPDTGKASVEAGYSSSLAQEYVKVYPNPSISEVNFSGASNLSLLTAGFYDVMGRQYFPAYSLEHNLISCDIHDLRSGVYLARLGWVGRVYWQQKDYPGSFTVPFVVSH